jgi:hypothetical protein
MQFCAETCCPFKLYAQVDEFGTISRNRAIGGLWRNSETPYIAFPGAIGLGFNAEDLSSHSGITLASPDNEDIQWLIKHFVVQNRVE